MYYRWHRGSILGLSPFEDNLIFALLNLNFNKVVVFHYLKDLSILDMSNSNSLRPICSSFQKTAALKISTIRFTIIGH